VSVVFINHIELYFAISAHAMAVPSHVWELLCGEPELMAVSTTWAQNCIELCSRLPIVASVSYMLMETATFIGMSVSLVS